MTPLQFEEQHRAEWKELEAALDQAHGKQASQVDGDRLAALYRRCCEHLALAQARAYPIHLTERLEQLTHRAHRLIYRRQDLGGQGLRHMVLVGFPQSVRAHAGYVAVAALLFVLPLLVVGWLTWQDPGFILHLMDANSVRQFDGMYGDGSHALGTSREADTDWLMFGHYIRNNIGIGFQCFAGGLFAGVVSVFCLVFNGLHIGAVAGYLTQRGHAENFYSFVITHGAFELTAIVLSGAAGLALGHALLVPGRRTRISSLREAARKAIVLVYGVFGMLLIAAGIEAFWSSARWVSPQIKYLVGTLCWVLVMAYLLWQGRPASAPAHKAARAEEPAHAR
jgi:uncharacterized membrane protein SpoIIM required for sporulation